MGSSKPFEHTIAAAIKPSSHPNDLLVSLLYILKHTVISARDGKKKTMKSAYCCRGLVMYSVKSKGGCGRGVLAAAGVLARIRESLSMTAIFASNILSSLEIWVVLHPRW
jgi:hypothetical protein